MTDKEALKLALEALEPFGTPRWAGTGVDKTNEAITAIKEALAQPAPMQEPVPDWDAWNLISRLNKALEAIGDYAHDKSTGPAVPDALWEVRSMAYDAIEDTTPPAQPEERNFCPRCGKRTRDLTRIHTCTPPQEQP